MQQAKKRSMRKAILIAGLILFGAVILPWVTPPIMITGRVSDSEKKYAQQIEEMKRKAEAAEKTQENSEIAPPPIKQ